MKNKVHLAAVMAANALLHDVENASPLQRSEMAQSAIDALHGAATWPTEDNGPDVARRLAVLSAAAGNSINHLAILTDDSQIREAARLAHYLLTDALSAKRGQRRRAPLGSWIEIEGIGDCPVMASIGDWAVVLHDDEWHLVVWENGRWKISEGTNER